MDKENQSADNWDKLKTISGLIASVLIPVVLAIIGNNFSNAIKEREIQAKYVELAINILNQETDKNERTKSWAVKIINEYSSVKIDSLTENEIIKNELISRLPQDAFVDFAAQKAWEGNLHSAIKGYDLAITKDSLNPQPYNLKGYAYYKMKDYKNALIFLGKSKELDDTYPWVHYNLALVYWAINEKDEAINEIERVILLDSSFKEIIAGDKQFIEFTADSRFDDLINR
ncbi:tetratricopeptide repeat protein [Hymenobacter sp. HDW8]|uniref:tetratricopeptide repeat protein n=1 Tax=Hymenobacter sp. HDW8 TaxID=2714932 RepID=UPI00140E058E|nr:CDC27 family protein [Hymenobacter sp. HDW8]QIL75868.1 hypothetical protein G7064_08370 [Hymenobacter sp. HDW8]